MSGTAANLRRGLELLKTVPTGGIDLVKLKFKQFFGIEGADEAELAQSFMKNVLKQLKPTFGAQFTEKEGRLLINIEARFGKSTAGDIRRVERAWKCSGNAADRGIKAAEEAGDFTAADAIRENMEFSLNPEDSEVIQPRVEIPQPPAGESGAIFTGKKNKDGFPIFKRPDGTLFGVSP